MMLFNLEKIYYIIFVNIQYVMNHIAQIRSGISNTGYSFWLNLSLIFFLFPSGFNTIPATRVAFLNLKIIHEMIFLPLCIVPF